MRFYKHSSPQYSRIARPVLAALLILIGAAALPSRAQAQAPVFSLTYSAKYICGVLTPPDFPSLGTTVTEMVTVVEVHNPNSTSVDVVIKVVQDFPEPGGISFGPVTITLGPNAAREFSCKDFPILPGTFGSYRKGFFEIKSQRALKVVSVYKEFNRNPLVQLATAMAKKSLPFFTVGGTIRHSGALFCGDEVTARGDTVRHETTIAVSNVTDTPVDMNCTVAVAGHIVNTFPAHVDAQGFISFNCNLLPVGEKQGTLLISYPGTAARLECEELVQKFVLWSNVVINSDMSVIEVQPVSAK